MAAAALALVAVVLFVALRSPSKSAADFTLFLGRFHPLAVHLPIGILLLVAFAEALSFSPKLRPRVDPAMSIVLPALVVTAVGSFFLGQLLASGGGFAAKLVGLHRTLTFVAVLGTALCFVLFRRSGRGAVWRGAYRAALFGTLGVLSIGAHYGGSITRGDGYLTKYAPGPLRSLLGEDESPKKKSKSGNEDAEATPPSADPFVFADVVEPILNQRCGECHGAQMMKGGLRLDTFENVQKGGDGGPAVIAGNPQKSPLYSRMVLPANDDDRMPPDGEPGPSADEIELIRWWIERGASSELKVRDVMPPPIARSILEKKLGDAAASGSAPTKTSAPSASSVHSSQEPGASSAMASSSASAEPSMSAPVAAEGSVWSGRVQPILSSKCGKCHGTEKQKGKLRVDSLAALLQGGKAGPSIVPKGSSQSLLLSRVHLPVTDDDHMPPAKEPQMTASETQLVAWWIDRGASADTKIADLPANLQNVHPSYQSPPAPSTRPTTQPTTTAWTPSPTVVPTYTAPTPTASTSSSAVAVAPDLSKFPATINLYRHLAQPVLVERCSNCHMAVSKSGDLDVETLPPLLAGGDSGPAVTPGDPDKSLIIQRISLPLSDSDHMPPDGIEGPTRGEVEGVRLWISRGAKEDTVVETKTLPTEVLQALEVTLPRAKPDPSPGPAPIPSVSAAPTATAPPSAVATASATTTLGQSPPQPMRPNAGCASCTVATNAERRASIWLAAVACSAFLWRGRRRRRARGSRARER